MSFEEMQSESFDPIQYINSKFPDEASLSGLDQEVLSLKSQLKELEMELSEDIYNHAQSTVDVKNEMQKIQQLTQEIVQETKQIHEKSQESEKLVMEMCFDIKNLDVAKKNITFSINAHKKYAMMQNCLEKLEDCCENKQYQEVANLINAFDILASFFKQFPNIPQVYKLQQDKQRILNELKKLILLDFDAFRKDSSEPISHISLAVEAIGIEFRNQLIQNLSQKIIQPYQELFEQSINATLENTERRFGWLWRHLKEFGTKYANVLPDYWGTEVFVLNEFCGVTRIQLGAILNNKNYELPVLMNALKQSKAFESRVVENLQKQYGSILSTSTQFHLHSIPKFKGCISDSFERYLDPYVESEYQELIKIIQQSLQQDQPDLNNQIKVFNSSLILFNSIKQTFKRASQYSQGDILLEIFKKIKKVLNYYLEELMNKMKQGSIQTACFVMNTSEYCKDTLDGLEKSVKQSFQQESLADQVYLQSEEEHASQVLSKTIDWTISFIDSKIDVDFQDIYKQSYDGEADISNYIINSKKTLTGLLTPLKENLNGLLYLFFINRLVLQITNKFTQNVYKCKKVTNTMLQQLRVDLHDLKMHLISLSPQDNKYVQKTIQKAENLLKLLELPIEKFQENFKQFFEDATANDFEKIMQLKQFKKTDVPLLTKIFSK